MEITVNGIKLFYEDRGAGVPLVLVHAFPLSGALWQAQLDALSDTYRVIVPDMRGFGRSDSPPGPYPMETYADDLAALLDALGLDQVVLGGLSMGGYTAFAFVRRYAARLRGLILADTRASADTEEVRANRESNAQMVEQQGSGAMAEVMVPKLLSPAAAPELQSHVRHLIETTSPQGIAGALRGMGLRPDSTDLLPTIMVPTLVIVGAEDALTPPQEMRTLHQAIAGSQMVEVPNAGHAACLENPSDFNAALRAFLQNV